MTADDQAIDARAAEALRDGVETWAATSHEHRARNAVRAIRNAGIALVAPAPTAEAGPEVDLGAPGVLWMAMRYALGRRTYAVGEACVAIVANVDRLTHWQAARMAGEIEQHLEWCAELDGETSPAFRDLDEQWRKTAHVLRSHAATREAEYLRGRRG